MDLRPVVLAVCEDQLKAAGLQASLSNLSEGEPCIRLTFEWTGALDFSAAQDEDVLDKITEFRALITAMRESIATRVQEK